jgi:hypothetical protein
VAINWELNSFEEKGDWKEGSRSIRWDAVRCPGGREGGRGVREGRGMFTRSKRDGGGVVGGLK